MNTASKIAGAARNLLAAAGLLLLLGGSALAAEKAPVVAAPQAKAPSSVLLAYGDDDIWDENGQIIKKGSGPAHMSVADAAAEAV